MRRLLTTTQGTIWHALPESNCSFRCDLKGTKASALMLSVIVCTHNPRSDYLQRVLESLSRQTLNRDSWELIVVDNASEPPLRASLDLTWHDGASLIEEEALGLINARLSGLRRARTDLFVFVDDDNVLSPNYLETTDEIAQAHPGLGAWGGQLIPEFERTPAPDLAAYVGALGIREFDSDRWGNHHRSWEAAPYGAGMCVRREIMERYSQLVGDDPLRSSLGVRGAELMRCEDIDIAFTAVDMGFDLAIFASLELTHLMPESRTTEEYLLRLHEANTYSAVLVNFLHGVTPPTTPSLGAVRRSVRRFRVDRTSALFREAEERGQHAARVRIAEHLQNDVRSQA